MTKLIDLLKNTSHTHLQGDLSTPIADIVYDSRKVYEGCVFVCLRGAVTDGHQYISQALEMGAVAFIAEEKIDVPSHIVVILVENARLVLAYMSAVYFRHPAKELKTIGVTGTKGKTTTVYMIKSILEKA
jgi:UDP-N-acetylmuramoyl-L-alanyl-D-glutamate--2,6-diaminopimelate ligase